MSHPVREQLLGYLLGALDDSEVESLEGLLQADPELRRELACLRRQLQALEAAVEDHGPPPGLARRTCDFVFAHARPAPAAPERRLPGRRRSMAPETTPSGRPGRLSWLDSVVSVTILLVAGMVVLPAIFSSRFQARLVQCQDNLRVLGVSLTDYSRRHAGYFPQVPATGKLAAAGVYAPTLVSAGLLPEARIVICPDSPLAIQTDMAVPTLEQLQAAVEREAARLRRHMGGSYGYCIGHVENRVLVPTRNLGRERFAIMADAPSDLPEHQSLNHGGRGQNVLFEDGHVMFLTTSQPCDSDDDIYSNDHHLVAPGDHCNDSVIAPSDVAPVIYVGDR
jgi:hypothetical protein